MVSAKNKRKLCSSKNKRLSWDSCPKVPLINILRKINDQNDKYSALLTCKEWLVSLNCNNTVTHSRYISAVTLPKLWSELDLEIVSSQMNYKHIQKYLIQFRNYISSIRITGCDDNKIFVTKPHKNNHVQKFFSILNLILQNIQKSDQPLKQFTLSNFGNAII